MKIFLKVFIVIIIAAGAFGCSAKNANVKTLKNGVELNSDDMNLKVQFYGEEIVRVLKWPAGSTDRKRSLSVILTTIPDVAVEIDSVGNSLIVSSGKLKLEISRADLSVKFIDSKNDILLQEKGTPSFSPVVFSGDSGFSMEQNFTLTNDEGIYGLGQHQYGYFNYRNKTVKLVQTNTDAVSSFLISTMNYGILWDNYSKTIFKDSTNGASFWSDMGDNIDYYFVAGKNMDEVISGYRELTGTAPMYGKYAYGYWQSKEHYATEKEVLSVADKYRKLKIPIDNIIQDWNYWGGLQDWSGMYFNKERYPSPKEMCDQLHRKNFHIIISIWAGLGPNTPIYKAMLKNGFLYSPVGWAGFKYFDAFNPAANQLYWQFLRDGLYSKGLDGWWIDSTEPDIVNAMTKESEEYEMKKTGRNFLGSWARYLNAYSLVMTDDIYKNWRNETSDRRAYILTRSTFSGQQRNAATTWSGDIGASWKIYKNQISAGVNHSMSGIPYWTFDIGAFVLGAYGGVFNEGGKNPAYQELYCRMFQLGAFSPVFRSHGSETPREIWEMGEFTKPILKFDNLRYRLMPYIYSLAWMVTDKNYTIMRGLPMDFTSDRKTYSIDDQFMFGPALMACPVTTFMYHHPPEPSQLVGPEFFKTNDGKPGLTAKYYKDNKYKIFSKEEVVPDINFVWYTGRPDYVTDSMYSVRWEGKLVPKETGKHQFHLISYDPKRIILNGDTLPIVYTSVEQYTAPVELEAGKEYNMVVETENNQTGAAKMQLFWKTPSTFEKEKSTYLNPKERNIYLPAYSKWFDFWTGKEINGGTEITAPAPIDIMPLYVKAGSIVPMGPFLQYAAEKPADPVELRIYRGADGSFTLYEDENDNYNYEKGVYSTITFSWKDSDKELKISDRKGDFSGMLKKRTFNVVLVSESHGTGVEIEKTPDKTINYLGKEIIMKF